MIRLLLELLHGITEPRRCAAIMLAALTPMLCSCGTRYAGTTRASAVAQARSEWTAIEALTGALSPNAKAREQELVSTAPTVSRAHCNGKQAWRVAWRGTFPIFVTERDGPLWGASAKGCVAR